MTLLWVLEFVWYQPVRLLVDRFVITNDDIKMTTPNYVRDDDESIKLPTLDHTQVVPHLSLSSFIIHRPSPLNYILSPPSILPSPTTPSSPPSPG